MKTLLALAAFLFLASAALGGQYLTLNGADIGSIDLYLDENCTIEVVADDTMAYMRKLYPTNFSLGDLEFVEVRAEAGVGASATPIGGTEYALQTAGTGLTAGVHFVFRYTARDTGLKEIELRPWLGSDPIDTVVVNVASKETGTAFTYQGLLDEDGSAAEGFYDIRFKLFESAFSSVQVGQTITKEGFYVEDGLFSTALDFGDAFDGRERWLEIAVRTSGMGTSTTYTTLEPRQQLTAAPYALYALQRTWKDSGDDIYFDGGSVGIGTSSPAWELDVANFGPGDGAEIGVSANDAGGALAAYSSTLPAPFVHYAGRVSVFANASTPGLDLRADKGYPYAGDIRFYTGGFTADNERVRIDASGDVGIGTTSPGCPLDVEGYGSSTIARFYNPSTSEYADGVGITIGPSYDPDNYPGTDNYFLMFKQGIFVIGSVSGDGNGGVFFRTTSDARLKTNIDYFTGGLDTVSRIKVRNYETPSAPGVKCVGFLAQELMDVYPQAVAGSPDSNVDEEPMMIDYGRLTPLLVQAIQELQGRVEELEKAAASRNQARCAKCESH